MIGVISSAQKSKSGATLTVMIDGKRYQSKNWELENMVGKEIIFESSPQTFPDGTSCNWLNDYQVSDKQTTPSGQAMEQAMDKAISQRDDVIFLPMTSNVVAHAIQAGLITKPEDLQKWADSAFQAAKSALEVPYV